MATKEKKSPVEKLVASLETRIKNCEKKKTSLRSEYMANVGEENEKITIARLQLKALKK